jgi:hypothetical protein
VGSRVDGKTLRLDEGVCESSLDVSVRTVKVRSLMFHDDLQSDGGKGLGRGGRGEETMEKEEKRMGSLRGTRGPPQGHRGCSGVSESMRPIPPKHARGTIIARVRHRTKQS